MDANNFCGNDACKKRYVAAVCTGWEQAAEVIGDYLGMKKGDKGRETDKGRQGAYAGV